MEIYKLHVSSELLDRLSTTQEQMADNLCDNITPNIWLPNSPDLNPLDYYEWSIVEKEVNKHPHNTKDSVKAFIVWVMSEIDKDQLIRACNQFQPHVKTVIDAGGGFIE